MSYVLLAGMDVVLNSLAEEKLQASLRLLAQHGRFLEIGKFDLSKNTALGGYCLFWGMGGGGGELFSFFHSLYLSPVGRNSDNDCDVHNLLSLK